MNTYKIYGLVTRDKMKDLLDKSRWLRKGRMEYVLGALFFMAFAFGPNAVIAQKVDDYGDKLGTVHFPVSCIAPAQNLMERGVALMHHMTYSGARKVFEAARAADPDCALAYWGIGMTYIHPLWLDKPNREQIILGQNLVKLAKHAAKRRRVNMPTSQHWMLIMRRPWNKTIGLAWGTLKKFGIGSTKNSLMI
jgi:hypothetical protein